MFWIIVLKVVVISIYANYLPFCLLSIKLKYLGFFSDFSICFVSFYIFKSLIFSDEFMLSKGKNMEEMCVYTTTAIHNNYVYLAISLHFFTPTCKFPFIQQISPLISQMLAFLGTLFIIILTIKM